jgi:hypothetical protein
MANQVTLWARLIGLLSGRPASIALLADRHQRREAARRRHRQSGAPLWTPDDRHLGSTGSHEVADVSPGLPGNYGSVRSIEND